MVSALSGILNMKVKGLTAGQWMLVICILLPVALAFMVKEKIIDRLIAHFASSEQ